MFSVIQYGRNDSHGYNLHKRAAISFNAIAEVMTDPDDEILFVDYNTPDDYPTFPEAISDTLTDKAKKVLRIFRVRPEQHAHLRHRTHLVALEPQSRNIALRRSNPRNRWILYTNTDMLLVPRDERQSLSDMLAIHGFDEAMLHGWHCDSNLAARLSLYRGSADTLADKVFAYHCDHTRAAAANNKGRKTTMNDQ